MNANFLKGIVEDELKMELKQEHLNVLYPEVEMKVINLLRDAKKIMKHCKWNYLKGTDIDLAHKTKLEDPFLLSIWADYQLKWDEDEDNMVLENKVEPLLKLIQKPILDIPVEPWIEFQWVMLNNQPLPQTQI